MLLYFAILVRGLSVLSCQLLNIHCQDEHDNEPRNWLWAILQEQSDAKSQLFHFKMYVERKSMIAELNKPYNSMHNDYF